MAGPSRWATLSAPLARGSPCTWPTSCAAAAGASARPRCAAAVGRAARCCCTCPRPVSGADLGPRGQEPGPGLVKRACDGDVRALGRLISLVENGAPELRAVLRELAPLTGRARVVGLTG